MYKIDKEKKTQKYCDSLLLLLYYYFYNNYSYFKLKMNMKSCKKTFTRLEIKLCNIWNIILHISLRQEN